MIINSRSIIYDYVSVMPIQVIFSSLRICLKPMVLISDWKYKNIKLAKSHYSKNLTLEQKLFSYSWYVPSSMDICIGNCVGNSKYMGSVEHFEITV